ncbi:MAG: hypothetical protein CMN77_12380 [Spirochaetaceae bacterium]|nr:hypothetical protein [Spirochaetaceae bacterium]|tara:strand:- start:510 stop:1058 length:549 start_codon:yes stop_codon:yes gene_type:complete
MNMQNPEEEQVRKNSGRMFEHPGIIRPRFVRMIRLTVVLTMVQLFWAGGIFYIGSKHPNLVLLPGEPAIDAQQNRITNPEMHQHRPVLYRPMVIYALYSMLHGFYVLIACGMARYLTSGGWLKTALIFSVIPTPGFLLGLFQVPLAAYFLHLIRQPLWQDFFRWQGRLQSVNGLTDNRSPQK